MRIVYNMYKNAKSCVFANTSYSDYFVSFSGDRQGENLSPLLFVLCVNDLKNVPAVEVSDSDLCLLFKTFCDNVC